nr:PREDICTED: uncharacterized protein LOC109031398 [Bemisia tabaci]
MPADALARKMHCLIAPVGYTTLAISWRKTSMMIEIAEEVNKLLLTDQFPISSSMRAAIITDLENRHRVIIICVMSGAQLMVLFYFVPPILKFLTSAPSSRQLDLPLNLPDPLALIGFTPTDVSRAIAYFICILSNMSHFYIVYLGKSLTFVIMDSLKTAFFICGQSLETFGHEGFLDTEQFLSAVKLHQRVLRLSSKVKNAVEPYFIVSLTASMCYNTTCALAVTHQVYNNEC